MKPFRAMPADEARAIRAIFTDVDGTLTTEGKLLPSTFAALWRWHRQGGRLVLVTGRPAGWAESFARMWPVDAVVAENGGLAFLVDGQRLRRIYATEAEQLARDRRRLFRAAAEVARKVPGARLSEDSRYTEVDLAIDYDEDVHLGAEAAEQIEMILRRRGLNAVRSSVHVNFWAGSFDKLSMCRTVMKRLGIGLDESIYVGDSLNDAPMFAGFRHSVGVANVREVIDLLPHLPRYVTRQREGRGFEEVVRRLERAG